MLKNIYNAEPIAVVTVIKLGLYMAVEFGLNLSSSQLVAIITFVEALAWLVMRGSVVSPATLNQAGHFAVDIRKKAEENKAKGIPPVGPKND